LRAKKIEYIDEDLINHEHDHANCIHHSHGVPKLKPTAERQDKEGAHNDHELKEQNNQTVPSACGSTYINYYDMDVFKTSIIACSKIPGLYSVINFGRRELE
jgi:hypothetical protein